MKILNIILAIGLLFFTIYLFMVERIELPSKYGAAPSVLMAPATYFIGGMPMAFSISIVLIMVDSEKYAKFVKIIVAVGVVLFFVGLVVVAPLMKAIG